MTQEDYIKDCTVEIHFLCVVRGRNLIVVFKGGAGCGKDPFLDFFVG